MNTAFNRKAIKSQKSHTIAVLGAGNVATHISRHLHAGGQHISCIWSRSQEHADRLAGQVKAVGISDLASVTPDADYYLLALPDCAIPQIASVFKGHGGIWMHTAGAVPMELLGKFFKDYGVFYPLQTLSAEREISLADTPMLLEGSDSEVLELIRSLASTVSATVIELDSARRLVVHMAAVFANNFTNHMANIAGQILEEHEADLSLLAPILRETFAKIEALGPARAQTGPAMRDDRMTMQKHLGLLKGHPEWEKLYTFISRDIGRSRLTAIHDPKTGDDQF
ncbi:MAG: DUF2520 domain-containing protein [Bacteroidota bacterium]